MSEFYKAKIDDLTKEQLAEIINHQTSLHVESKALLVLAKQELQSRDAEIEDLKVSYAAANIAGIDLAGKIEKRDKLLEQAKPWVLLIRGRYIDSEDVKIDQWFKDTKELEGE